MNHPLCGLNNKKKQHTLMTLVWNSPLPRGIMKNATTHKKSEPDPRLLLIPPPPYSGSTEEDQDDGVASQ